MRTWITIFLLVGFVSVSCTAQAWVLSPVCGGVASGSDGAIGTSTHDGTNRTVFTGYQYHEAWTPTTSGTVQYAHIYVEDSNNQTFCVSLTDNTGTVVLSCSAGGSGDGVPQWFNCDAGSSTTVNTGTTYYLNVEVAASEIIVGTVNDDNDLHYCDIAYSCGQNIDVLNESVFSSADRPTILWNNTSGSP